MITSSTIFPSHYPVPLLVKSGSLIKRITQSGTVGNFQNARFSSFGHSINFDTNLFPRHQRLPLDLYNLVISVLFLLKITSFVLHSLIKYLFKKLLILSKIFFTANHTTITIKILSLSTIWWGNMYATLSTIKYAPICPSNDVIKYQWVRLSLPW